MLHPDELQSVFSLKWSLINLKICEIKLFELGIKNFQQLKAKKQTKTATSIRKWLNMTTTEMLKLVVLVPKDS